MSNELITGTNKMIRPKYNFNVPVMYITINEVNGRIRK